MDIQPRNRKAVSTRVDLTAMVDLGFLLITFFLLATSFNRPKVMEILKPVDGDPSPIAESKTATILIGPGDKAYCYSLPDELESLSDIRFDSISYHASGLRTYILHKQAEVKSKWGNADQLFLIIKPMDNSSFQHLVDVLDEIRITDVQHYAIVNEKTVVDSVIMAQVKRN